MSKKLNDQITTEFKTNLKAILEERKGKTNPKKLSVSAGLGETAVRDILHHRSVSPKLETVNKIANALEVPLYRLIPSMINESYDEISELKEEIRLLREASDFEYEDMNDLKRKAMETKKLR